MVAVSLQLMKRILCVLHTGTVPEDKLLGELFCHRQLRRLFCYSSYCLPKQTPSLETTVNFRWGTFSTGSWQYLEVFLGITVAWLVPPCKDSCCDFTHLSLAPSSFIFLLLSGMHVSLLLYSISSETTCLLVGLLQLSFSFQCKWPVLATMQGSQCDW